jgi:hypothetical protein
MSLPLPWVEKIFEKLTLTYGQAFLARWRDIDLNAVKSDWMHELSSFQQSPNRIAFALEHLPERPPSVIDFKALCAQYKPPEPVKLPEPPADPERLAAELAKLAPLRALPTSDYDSRAWAKSILRDHKGGLRINPTKLQMARNAVGGVA